MAAGLTDKRRAGVLLSVSSLPGPFGIGVFGEEAKRFVDRIRKMGFSYWQVLPLGPVDHGNSPYCGESAFAGNGLYIDPRGLERAGLVTPDDVAECYYPGTPHTADYAFAKEKKKQLLLKAYENFFRLPFDSDFLGKYRDFLYDQKWVSGYGRFMALKELSGTAAWNTWKSELSEDGNADRLADFYCFVQFLFFSQWAEIRKYANDSGISIIGDMPLYISYESADVSENITDFQIDPLTLKPFKVAGVPPDYFSETGQLWGNPLYDWEKMRKNGFSWWKARLKTALDLYDVVRIDHFRGLASYWAIPADSDDARTGAWEKGPGKDLFDAFESIPGYTKDRLIAEDLGVFGEDVEELLRTVGLPGMKVIQFAFDDSFESSNLPHNYGKNTIAYVGTHDNNTILGWLWEALPQERDFALRYCGFQGDDWSSGGYKSASCRALTEAVWKSHAKLAVVSVQDMCGFGKDCRMNIPGEPEGNWRFRITDEALDNIDFAYYKEVNKIFGRN